MILQTRPQKRPQKSGFAGFFNYLDDFRYRVQKLFFSLVSEVQERFDQTVHHFPVDIGDGFQWQLKELMFKRA